MTRRANPRPAFVDLFAALLIASFGGFIMLTGAYQQELRFSEDAAQKIKDMRYQLASYYRGGTQSKKVEAGRRPNLRAGPPITQPEQLFSKPAN